MMFQRLLLVWLSACAIAMPQVSQIVTSRDGSVVYFSSALTLRDDPDEVSWSKIFRYRRDTGKVELAYQVKSYGPVNAWGGTTPYQLSIPM